MLKKIAAISFIIILAFNWVGYKFVLDIMVKGAEKELNTRLDANDYNEGDLIEFRVDLNLPYQRNDSEFERCSGEIKIGDRYYSYVKRKIENGQLVLKCIPNHSKQQISNAGNNYFKGVNDIDQQHQSGKKQDTPSFQKNISGDYDNRIETFELAVNGQKQLNKNLAFRTIILPHRFTDTPWQPPETAC